MALHHSAVRRSAKGDATSHSATACSRLRRLQRLLHGSLDSKPDALLCILGIDSRYNEGCSELANYLLFGFYAQDHPELDRKSFPEEVLDDVIILVKAESVHLYCNPVNYPYLLPYVALWRNLRVHCMTAKEYEDEEAGEEFKITSFVNMVQDCKTVGVPYSAQGHPQKFDMFVMEKWPMIQAFALDGIGGGGFFTMKHELVDLSEDLWDIYSQLDPVSLESLITEELVLFEWQWKAFFSNFDIETPASILDLSEAQVGEPFRSYFNHGMLSSHITSKSGGGSSSSNRRQPLVLFGSRTGRQGMEDNNFSFPSESHLLRNTGPAASHARHMVIQCSNPKGPISCARTYFFGSSHTPYMGNSNEQQRDPVLRVLSGVYASGVEAVLAGIAHYTETGDPVTTKTNVEQVFFSCLDKYDLSKYKATLRSAWSFIIQAINLQGRAFSVDQDACKYHVKTASLLVYDIPDLEEGKLGVLGSVAFSESFLDSRAPVRATDGSLSVNGRCALLTANIPRYTSWLVDEAGVILSEKAQEIIKGDGCGLLGTRIAGPDLAYIHCSSPFSNPEEGKLSLLSSGVLFVHRKYGSVILPMSHMTAIKFYDGDSPSVVAMVVIEYKRSLLPFLPFHLSCATFSLAFGLMPKSTAYKTFYREVLSSWRNGAEEFGVVLKMISQQDLSEQNAQLYADLEMKHASMYIHSVGTGRPSIYTSLPRFEKFFKHFEVSSLLLDPVPATHFTLLMNPSENENKVSEDLRGKMVITIITGLPGSHREHLCATLVNLSKEHDRWAVLHNSTESGAELSAEALQRYLSGVLQTNLHRSPRHTLITRKKLRVLVLAPGFADVVDVVRAIMSHPDPTVRSHFVIGAITTCVNPLAAYMEHSLTFPKLLEQCAKGWVSNVVLTGPSHENQHPRLKQLKETIRLVNPSAALIQAESGNVSRNEDVEMILSESSFNDAAMIRARYLLTPGWASGIFNSGVVFPPMQQISVHFRRPLEKPLFIGHCKALKGMLSSSPFHGNIYSIKGRLKFSDSPKLVEVSHITLANSLMLTTTQEGPVPRPPPTPRGVGGLVGDKQSTASTGTSGDGHYHHLVFTGCGLKEERLKDWLRRSAKQIPQKKLLKTKDSLTQRELMSIHATRHLDPLPPGYFYNGMQFISFFGEKSNQHPLMETFIDEYLEKLNAEINKYNAALQRVAHNDIFEA